MRTMVVVSIGVAILVASAFPASALPSVQPDSTWMTDGQVRAIQVAGKNVWLGGRFDHLLDASGATASPAVSIAALSKRTEAKSSVATAIPSLGGIEPFVYDLALDPAGTVLYAAGLFDYSVGNKDYRNLVALDPVTGAIVEPYHTPALRTVFPTSDRLYLGGAKLWSYRIGGREDTSFIRVVPSLDPSLRGHEIDPTIRDIGLAPDGDLLAVGQFDFINGNAQKAAVKVDRSTGAVRAWKLSNLAESSTAFGIGLFVSDSTMYFAGGGSDYAAAYRASDGKRIWLEDTSGSTQAILPYDANTLVIGGHFQWIEDADTPQCGSNDSPNTGCLNQPRLAALDASTGLPIDTWSPNVCCKYNGVWVLAVDARGRLRLGGEFTKVGGQKRQYYARLPA